MIKDRYEYYKGTSNVFDNETNEFVDDIVERLNTQDYNKRKLLEVKQKQDKQLAELKEEKEDAEECAIDCQNKNTELETEIENLKTQMNLMCETYQKQSNEIKMWKDKTKIALEDFNDIQQELGINTHEVCEKIRDKLPNYIYSFQEPETPRTKVIEYSDVEYILDIVEKGENDKLQG